MKNILIAGGAGFIGANLINHLINECNIICVDIFFSGKKNNIIQFAKHSNFNLVEKDIRETLEIKEPLDEIWNLASPASPVFYQRDPVLTSTTNFIGTKNLLDLAVKHGAKFLQASTSEIYGNPLEHPQKESYWGNVNPIGPRSCYDEGKRIAETLTADYRRIYNIDAKITRIFNTYGPNMRSDDGRVISNFIVQALKNEDITIYGDGAQTRSFQFITDLINGLEKVMASKNPGPYNLGNPEEIQIKDLARKIIELSGSQSRIIYKELPEDDPEKRKPDIQKSMAELNWQPTVPLEDGLVKTIDFFKTVL